MARTLNETNGGATVNRYFGDLGGQALFVVSLYPERTRRVAGQSVTEQTMTAFLADNDDLLGDPRNNVGLWYAPSRDTTFVDVSAALPDRDDAIVLGERYNQIAVFDLARFEEIETGGTGLPPSDAPPAPDRLPPLLPRRL